MGDCKECDGCSAKDGFCDARDTDQEWIDPCDERIHKCPCRTCLVKMICVEMCKPYEDLWDQ